MGDSTKRYIWHFEFNLFMEYLWQKYSRGFICVFCYCWNKFGYLGPRKFAHHWTYQCLDSSDFYQLHLPSDRCTVLSFVMRINFYVKSILRHGLQILPSSSAHYRMLKITIVCRSLGLVGPAIAALKNSVSMFMSKSQSSVFDSMFPSPFSLLICSIPHRVGWNKVLITYVYALFISVIASNCTTNRLHASVFVAFFFFLSGRTALFGSIISSLFSSSEEDEASRSVLFGFLHPAV